MKNEIYQAIGNVSGKIYIEGTYEQCHRGLLELYSGVAVRTRVNGKLPIIKQVLPEPIYFWRKKKRYSGNRNGIKKLSIGVILS